MEDAAELIITHALSEIEGRGNLKATVHQTYTPPLDGKSDDYAGFDMRIAKGIGELLNKHYFGYTWKSFADTKQGIVGFSIPDLMGPTLHMIINLKQFSDLQPDLIISKAGELLERMHLPRGQIDMAAYAFAKTNRRNFDFSDVQSTGNK
jgi:hypothetical protein